MTAPLNTIATSTIVAVLGAAVPLTAAKVLLDDSPDHEVLTPGFTTPGMRSDSTNHSTTIGTVVAGASLVTAAALGFAGRFSGPATAAAIGIAAGGIGSLIMSDQRGVQPYPDGEVNGVEFQQRDRGRN